MYLNRLRYLLTTLIVLIPHLINAQSKGLDERINDAFMPFAIWWENLIFAEITIAGFGIPVVLILLLSGALFFTFYFGFVNVRHFPTAIQVVRGKYDDLEKSETSSAVDSGKVELDLEDTTPNDNNQNDSTQKKPEQNKTPQTKTTKAK